MALKFNRLKPVLAIHFSDRNATRMKLLHDIAREDPARLLKFAPFFLGPQHAKGLWDGAGATFKYHLDHDVIILNFFTYH